MKALAIIVLALVSGGLVSHGGETALEALRGLPKADARNLVRMAARDGLASPENWYVTVYDREAPSSLRVLVVAKGEVVTSQDVPAAEAAGLSKELLDSSSLRIDSDQAADVALSYAAANQVKVSFLNYELARQGARAVPVWIVTCLDQNSNSLGSLVITASKGNVVASEGFTNQPTGAPLAKGVPGVAGVDPRIELSDRQFLESQSRGTSAAPVAAPPADEPDASVPPVRTENRPPIVASKGKASKAKATPRSARVSREIPSGPIVGVEVSPRDDIFDDTDDDDIRTDREAPRRRPTPVVSSRGDDLPREVRRVRSFIHRLLPF